MPASLPSLGNVHDRIAIEQSELTRLMQEYALGREAERACCALIHNDHHLSDARTSENRLDDIEESIVELGYEISVQATIKLMLRCYAQHYETSLDHLSLSHTSNVDLYVKSSMKMFFEFVEAISMKMDEQYKLRRIAGTHRVILEARAAIQGLERRNALELLQQD